MNDKITAVTDEGIDIELEAPKPKAKRRCLCGLVRIDFPAANVAIEDLPKKYREYAELNDQGYEDGGWVHVETGCTEMTNKLFAPGHDARFKGLLQTAHRQGGEVAFEQDGLLFTSGPVDFAIERTPNLVEAITREVKVRPKKARAAAPKARKVRAKVRRWEYDGEIVMIGKGPDATEQFIYENKDGKSVAATNFTIIKEIA